ncbi:hypothetical protein Tco_0218262 [Tanacetum coccineum]
MAAVFEKQNTSDSMTSLTGTSSLFAAAGSVNPPAVQLPVTPRPAESTQQSPHLSGPQSADPAQPENQPAPICLQHEPSRTPSHVPVLQ